jgi:hypothetical protein
MITKCIARRIRRQNKKFCYVVKRWRKVFARHCFWWVVAGAILIVLGVGLYPIIRVAGTVAVVGGLIFFIIWLITCIEQFDEWADEFLKERSR